MSRRCARTGQRLSDGCERGCKVLYVTFAPRTVAEDVLVCIAEALERSEEGIVRPVICEALTDIFGLPEDTCDRLIDVMIHRRLVKDTEGILRWLGPVKDTVH
jgi:hypothetical protein